AQQTYRSASNRHIHGHTTPPEQCAVNGLLSGPGLTFGATSVRRGGRMSGRLECKVAVVTGGGNGIGRATAVRFAEEGAAVVVADLLDGPGHETVAQIEALGGRAIFVSVDVTSRADDDAMARAAIEQFDALNIVVTAAGVA